MVFSTSSARFMHMVVFSDLARCSKRGLCFITTRWSYWISLLLGSLASHGDFLCILGSLRYFGSLRPEARSFAMDLYVEVASGFMEATEETLMPPWSPCTRPRTASEYRRGISSPSSFRHSSHSCARNILTM